MQNPAPHPLRLLFQQAVHDSFIGKLGLSDPEVNNYIANLLFDFTSTDTLYKIRDKSARQIKKVDDMMLAADPVYGTAASFDQEREVCKHVGDVSLFNAGMWPESRESPECIRTGKESYRIVSLFNLFEYESQVPLFKNLADGFERYVEGLNIVHEKLIREELKMRRLPPPSTGLT